MKSYRALLLGILLTATPAAAAPTQFNLRCTGTVEKIATASNIETSRYEIVFRVDLAAARWCADDCKIKLPIAKIDDVRIMLLDHEKNDPSVSERSVDWIDRTNGQHTYRTTLKTFGRYSFFASTSGKGSCELEDFTGFPEVVTKF